MIDDSKWRLLLPPCPHCERSHVLIDCCSRRLEWEVNPDARP